MTDFDYTLAYVFPGQGSQSVGMLGELAAVHPQVGETFAEASEVLGYDLWQLVQNGPEEQLNQTDRTQPAMLAAGVAVWRVLARATDRRPAMLAGHSLGEYSALVCAGVLEFPAAVKLVESRARFMQQAVPAGEGAMAAILGLDDEAVRAVCEEAAAGEVVEQVNFNAPGQVVIAGAAAAVERAVAQAKAAGAKRAVPLPVSVPSHCSLMQPAAEALAGELARADLRTPSINVIHNVDVRPHSDANEIRDLLARQLHNPVRWVETIRYMQAEGVTRLIECGPGKVLAGLNRRIAKDMTALPVYDPASLDAALEQI
ncbi:ACP S-malonyltransferase [Thiohalobacter thiocyanaticus]|uniref:Malonyl CoA-acyl carrier protein transacylase n=1 Tax=Thiohalobacter thiocyanaticus TaxID=585455 RepID=A0A426QFS4_9GAMM|nr:ACP S-malonyltransferase [Thiohalobacter thiocyanaticus]RRQ20592.1 [acyl-carrier-protein] S-malonyltransferase [Thiohalobacter thiocyanaticus]